MQQWEGFTCDCSMTSYSGNQCNDRKYNLFILGTFPEFSFFKVQSFRESLKVIMYKDGSAERFISSVLIQKLGK